MNEFGTTTTSFYRHSGKTPLLGLFLVGLAGFIATPILGLVYGYLIFYIPLVYLGILLVGGYIVAVSFVLSKAAILGKIRNTFIVGLAGFGFGLLAEYVGWVAWIAAIAKNPAYLLEFFFPFDVATIIIEIGQRGAWSFDGNTPTGALLYLIWLVEALAVVGGITYFTVHLYSDAPFCENSDVWANKKSALAAFAPLANPAQFKESISQGMFSAFNELKPIQAGNAFTLLELYECNDCKNFFVLNFKDVKISVDYRGRRNRKDRKIISNLIISSSTLSGLKRMIQEKTQAQQPAIAPGS